MHLGANLYIRRSIARTWAKFGEELAMHGDDSEVCEQAWSLSPEEQGLSSPGFSRRTFAPHLMGTSSVSSLCIERSSSPCNAPIDSKPCAKLLQKQCREIELTPHGEPEIPKVPVASIFLVNFHQAPDPRAFRFSKPCVCACSARCPGF